MNRVTMYIFWRKLLSLFLFFLCIIQSSYVLAKVTEIISGSHYWIKEYYLHEDDAKQACENFLIKHGYSGGSGYCGRTFSSGHFYYSAGWL